MVVILYQGYGPERSTVVTELPKIICWADTEFPRLDFKKPHNWNHCPNFWGSFILAIAQVQDVSPSAVMEDPRAKNFIHIADSYGVLRKLPKTFPQEWPRP